MKRFAILGFLLLCACTHTDKAYITQFEPLSSSGFRYSAQTGSMYPVDSATSEQIRLEWLGEYVHDTGLCSRGYEIVDRRFVRINSGLWTPNGTLYYEGKCKP